MSLNLDWCSQAAARYACVRWHYSGSCPSNCIARLGVWENQRFVGAVVFGKGVSSAIGKPYNLDHRQIAELMRVALDRHEAPVTRILAVAIRMVKKQRPWLRLLVSYAASEQGHHGGIYQGGNWIYEGEKKTNAFFKLNNNLVHSRSIRSRHGNQSLDWIRRNLDIKAERGPVTIRHKYLFPLDDEMRQQVAPLAKPYPKRAKQASASPLASGGAAPTCPLQVSELDKKVTA